MNAGRYPLGSWAEPVDEVAVLRLIDGTLQRRPTGSEIRAAIRTLERYRLSASVIACRLGISSRTVFRYRSRLIGRV